MFMLQKWKVSLGEIHGFLQPGDQIYLEQREPKSTLKKQSCQTYLFQKVTQFSQGCIVLDMPASRSDAVLVRDTCVSSTQLDMSIWNKGSLSLPLKPRWHEVFFSKTKSALPGKQCARC
jgi:long-subunit acyl-CoA synthetase (AMP-forming)